MKCFDGPEDIWSRPKASSSSLNVALRTNNFSWERKLGHWHFSRLQEQAFLVRSPCPNGFSKLIKTFLEILVLILGNLGLLPFWYFTFDQCLSTFFKELKIEILSDLVNECQYRTILDNFWSIQDQNCEFYYLIFDRFLIATFNIF